ncbi:TIGR04255 family protein [Chitinophaga sp. S165]|uniref:TIGR04255 family protein n=1 Tax=Chitinophaga sp. S165 TaxID=2135462 RepID=UPI000D71D9A2|nr:TIGR04255 family protein [Chitinophaga sp. S165]PWV53517.1 uncharacterized protein (TIGR04255 family) [Chitinophaga sp. S165]
MHVSKKYKFPPLVEAISEFRFATEEGVSFLNFVPTFYERIKEKFPIRGIKTKYGLKIEESKDKSFADFPKDEIEIYQFKNVENNLIVQVGNDFLAINHLKEYSNWENYSDVVLNILRLFSDLTKGHILQPSIRYINRISFDKVDSLDLDEYFKIRIMVPSEIQSKINSLNLRTELWSEDKNNLLTVAFRSDPGKNSNKFVFFLELGYRFSQGKMEFNQIDYWLSNAHKSLNLAFEYCLTEKCKQKFEYAD